MNAMNEREAHRQALELQAGLAHLKQICGDDEELLADMIDGELSLDKFVTKVITLIAEDEAASKGIKEYTAKVSARKKRIDNRAQRLRILLATVIAGLPGRKFKCPLATVHVSDIKPGLVVEEEADIPSEWFKQADPVLDEARLRKHLNERRKALEELDLYPPGEEREERRRDIDEDLPDVPGVHLDNGDITVTISVN